MGDDDLVATIRAATSCMRRWPADVSVQGYGCSALHNCGSDGKLERAQLKAVKEAEYATGVPAAKRGKRRVEEEEAERLEAVLAHPAFVADPLGAVLQHLNATLPLAAVAEPARRKKKR